MKDMTHHLKHVQRKVLQSIRKSSREEDKKSRNGVQFKSETMSSEQNQILSKANKMGY
jgi:hypothetical protein